MATEIIKMRIQLRRDTAANWELYKDVVPADGEPCFVTDKNILKIGDGVTTFENLQAIGGAEISADGKSIIYKNGILKLAGFDEAETGAQPRKSADGSIEWVVPSTETVEGLQTTIAGLQSDVTNLQTNVTEIQQIVMSSDDGTGTLLDRVESLEIKMDGTGEGTVDARIATAVADKVTAEEGKSLVEDNLIAKIEAIEEGAQVNKIEAIKVGNTLLDIVDKVAIIPMGLGIKGSDEINVNEDGTLSIKSISFDKIKQDTDTVFIMDGGSAV